MTFPRWSRTFAVAGVGALLGLLYLWTTSTRDPESMTLTNGWEVMHPVYVTPTPWWMYPAFAVLGVGLALLAVAATFRLVRLGRS